MRKVLSVLVCSVLFAGGCANKEAAKKAEEPVAPSATAPAASQRQTPPPIVESTPAPGAPGAAGAERAPGVPAPPTMEGAAPKAEAPQTMAETPTRETTVKPESEQQAQKAAAAQAAAGQQEEIQKIYFDFDSAALSDASREALSKIAEHLKHAQGIKIRIEGNCDERGSDEYNLALGERRAKAAMEYLVSLGVSEDRLSTISYGEERPADQGHTEEAWAKNRRDEFVILK